VSEAFEDPLLLVTKAVGELRITRATARGETADVNMQILVLLAQTFFRYASGRGDSIGRMWDSTRGSLGIAPVTCRGSAARGQVS